MHDIPEHAEQLLRSQGVTDAELDELRRTGRLERSDGTTSISIDSTQLTPAQIPQQTLDQLRRFHKLIPKAQRDQIELATGQDIDGDGRIAAGSHAAPTPVDGANAHEHVARSTHGYSQGSAAPATSSGPFVGETRRRAGSALLKLLLAVVVVVAVVAYLLPR